MRRWWPRPSRCAFRPHTFVPSRWFSSPHHVETVAVQCASSGSIHVNLHNVSQYDRSHPLVIYLPPFFQSGLASPPPLPAFLRSYPSAVINYRWLDPSSGGYQGNGDEKIPTFRWPSPVHDTLFGYSWIAEHLAPPGDGRRDVYVYGSYLGGSLAASLALTESRTDRPLPVRGFLTYNGIYNWTMFLPDHPIYRNKPLGQVLANPAYHEGSFFNYLSARIPAIFSSPSGLFDPFASPSLFFHNPGMWVPDDFNTPVAPSPMSQAIDALSSASSSSSEDTDDAAVTSGIRDRKPPNKGYLTFPPRGSTLKIPEALLLYESPPPRPYGGRQSRQRKTTRLKRVLSNNFEGQAIELSSLMRRSIEKYELDGSKESDEATKAGEAESQRRVQAKDVGQVEDDGQLGGLGESVAGAWLKERIG